MKRETLEPVPGIDGDARLSFTLKDDETIETITLEAMTRLFLEEALRNRDISLLPTITPSICPADSWSHYIASIMALEKIFQLNPAPYPETLRRLGLYLEIISNHTVGTLIKDYRLITGRRPYPEVSGLLETLGEMRRIIGGRILNPVFLIPGGATKTLKTEEIDKLKKGLSKLRGVLPQLLNRAIGEFKNTKIYGELLELDFPEKTYGARLNQEGAASYLSGKIVSKGPGIDRVDADWEFPAKLSVEYPAKTHSVKLYFFEKPLVTGPLARLNLAGKYEGQGAMEARDKLMEEYGKPPYHNPVLTMHARMIEILELLDRMLAILSDTEWVKQPVIVRSGKIRGQGTGVVESARGLVIHEYRHRNGLLESGAIITPTMLNAPSIMVDLGVLRGEKLSDEVVSKAVLIASSYDPCLDAATLRPVVTRGGGEE